MKSPITNTVRRPLDETPEVVGWALSHLDPLRPLTEALAALGCAGRAAMHKCDVSASSWDTTAFSLSWLLGNEDVADITWTLSVLPFGDGASMLSSCVRARAQTAAGDEQLLAAWPLLGRVVESHTARMLDAIAALAEDLAESQPHVYVGSLISEQLDVTAAIPA